MCECVERVIVRPMLASGGMPRPHAHHTRRRMADAGIEHKLVVRTRLNIPTHVRWKLQ